MGLSEDLISQFAKVTNDSKEDDKETTVYGTVVKYEGRDYVKLDGSELLTPISSTAVANDGERVTVMIKNHTATITGNISSPAARNGDVSDISNKITEFEIIISDRVVADDIEAVNGYFESIKSKIAKFSDMEAITAQIETLQAKYASLDHVTATDIEAINADVESLKAKFGDFTNISADDLKAINAELDNVKAYNAKFTYVSADVLKALKAEVVKLDAEKLSATDAEIKYANIDFANINQAAITKLFTDSGIIKDLIVSEGKITGELVGVTIKGDIIEGGTVKADKLVVKGSDGLFYKLNVDGADGITTEQTEYNSLNGSVITAKSVTAEKVAVDDLVAFDATIGGFTISDTAIYSGVKSSADNTTRGIYMDKDGQWNVGDASNFIKYYRDTDGSYKLAISARSIKLSTSGVDLETAVSDAITSSVEEFYLSTSPTSLSGGSWSTSQPAWTQGKYIWRRTAVTYGNGSSEYTPNQNGVCITGNTGDKGADAAITSNTAPSDKTRLWCDTSVDPPLLKRYDGSKWTVVNDVNVGGRNYFALSKTTLGYVNDSGTITGDNSRIASDFIPVSPGEVWIFQAFDNDISGNWYDTTYFDANKAYAGGYDGENFDYPYLMDKFTIPANVAYIRVSVRSNTNATVRYKLEKGNKATDWTPAPEDLENGIDNAQSTADTARDTANNNQETIIQTRADLQILQNCIASLVTDENGASLMTQTPDGFTFNIGSIQSSLNNAMQNLNTLEGDVASANSVIASLNSLTSDLAAKTAYIVMSTDDTGAPCIELGKEDNPFKVRITNTSIDFMEGAQKIAYITNHSLYIQSSVVTDDLQIGEAPGWIWKKRANGNLGLRWKP